MSMKAGLNAALAVGFAVVLAHRPASATELLVATWGGGVEKVWKTAFADPFEKETGIKVRIVPVPTPDAQLRTQAGHPQYNAVMVTYPQGANLMRDGLIEMFDPAALPATADTSPDDLMRDAQGRLAGASPYFMYYGIAVNTDLAKPGDFSSWSELANPKWKEKIAITRPIYLSSYDLPMLAKAAGGDVRNIEPGLSLLKQVVRNTLTTYTSIAHMNGLLTRGEIAAGPYYSGRLWHLRQQGARNVTMVVPREGALMIPYLLVVPRGARDMEATTRFLNYVSQAEPQARGAVLGGYLPLNRTAKLPPEAEEQMGMSLKELMSKLYRPDWAYTAEHEEERINIIEKLIADTN
ncbi:extracellular solute-binding protein [Bradyrhizobium sp. U87765 SZCCT0131]|uniref:extracellular solute-binding protein n=1 Tax=unclassified Bradyrhizobium TaxID=2631580 RepID=UPI001BA4B87C|nr:MULTISPECIES: extracellular solute-binding protein [unclassified Bradyrhizobium]MBR1217219.1 extracellular solute-binding protein [Bradyrhizobium sp. U87765 SZCCT0131]MBR1259025.1 extracellular solute-binding protein [Bradyrhizobium sp. U87765 SZCCT0134]MBR1305166.1 extracellular solute-binding protein [Bradyrhizobium sp. U87765 SZCCT0110]MBR1320952.1 extracellular solute-binding protein [Bradyrhizobium sp. U87765 SZCCT0109]MBR1350394.1 extracellular solute-binding protein [Bradyrhizobium s